MSAQTTQLDLFAPETHPLINQIRELYQQINDDIRDNPGTVAIHSPQEAAYLFMPKLEALDQEELWIMALTTRNTVLEMSQVYRGSVNQSQVRIAEVIRRNVILNAPALIIAHNHPSGDPTPSPDDVAVTRAIREACRLLDIELLDHLVIGSGRYVSLKERRLGFE